MDHRYAERLPIGTEDIIRNVPAEVVRAFYERWYRPENMAVVAVGDISDSDSVVQQISQAFGQGRSRDPAPAPQLPIFDFTPHTQPRYKVFIDKEVQESTVFVSFKQKRPPMSTPKQLLDHFESYVFQEVLNTRLFKLSREQEPPFAVAAVSEEPLCATTQSLVLTAVAMEGPEHVLLALETLLVEVARIRQHGISNKQIAPALADLKADIESTYKERDQSFCWDVRDEYIRNFLRGDVF
ncbi:peptidase M16 inactive domain-containing protein, partial [Dunaliella salina]